MITMFLLIISGYMLTKKNILPDDSHVALSRLVIIPAVFVMVLKLIGINETILSLALICFATPLGMNTIVYPAAYGGDFRTGASMTMISSTLSVITIPIMYLVFIVLL